MKNSARYHKLTYLIHVKYLLFLSDFIEIWIFATYFLKIIKYQISRKSVQWELTCTKRMDRRVDITKLIVAFHNFAKAPKNNGNLFSVNQACDLNSFLCFPTHVRWEFQNVAPCISVPQSDFYLTQFIYQLSVQSPPCLITVFQCLSNFCILASKPSLSLSW